MRLVGASFHQVSRTVAEQLARAQFAEKTVATNADESEHLEDFANLWDGLDQRWCESLADAERECRTRLCTDAERGAFRIIRSFARKAAMDGNTDFPIAVENLGNRLGLLARERARCGRSSCGSASSPRPRPLAQTSPPPGSNGCSQKRLAWKPFHAVKRLASGRTAPARPIVAVCDAAPIPLRGAECAAKLAKRTLTNLYNERPQQTRRHRCRCTRLAQRFDRRTNSRQLPPQLHTRRR